MFLLAIILSLHSDSDTILQDTILLQQRQLLI
jgi:hypothetical protein